ncbi:uncharacterized protein LOC144662440 [Oculina patagonica]
MQAFVGDEPRNEFLEKVYLGRRLIHVLSIFTYSLADVELTYDSRTGGFSVQGGYIIEETYSTLTVQSNGGYTYVVTRHPGGVYETDSWWSWVSVYKYRLN